jgi:hypothetical protein
LTPRARIGIEKRSGLPTAPNEVPRATSSSHSPSGVEASALGWSVARSTLPPADIRNTAPYSGGQRTRVIFGHPGRGGRDQGQPEEQVQVRPQDARAHVRAGVQEVVVVVSVDTDEHGAQHVAEQHGQQRFEGVQVPPCGTFNSSTMMVMISPGRRR